MGYTQYCDGIDLKSIIREKSTGWSRTTQDGAVRTVRCLTKCIVGTRRFKCRLWLVFQPYVTYPAGHPAYPTGVTIHHDAFIVVYSLDCQNTKDGRRWGYRDYSESCHPFIYDCPLSYLEMCPETCAEWRQHVRNHHIETPRRSPCRRGESAREHEARQIKAQSKAAAEAAKQAAKFARQREAFVSLLGRSRVPDANVTRPAHRRGKLPAGN